MSKKDMILMVIILAVMLILFIFGYQDYKRQNAMLVNPVGIYEGNVAEEVFDFNG